MLLIVWFKPVFVHPDVPKFGYKIVFVGPEATLWGCWQVKIWELIIFDFIAALNGGGCSISGTWSDSGCKQRTTDRCASAWSPCLRLVTAAQVGTRTKYCVFTRMENYYYYSLLYRAILCSRADSLYSYCMWLHPFIVDIFNIHQSAVLTALFGCCVAGATWNWCCRLGVSSVYTIRPCTSLQCHFIQSQVGRLHVCRDLNPGPFSRKSDALTTEARVKPCSLRESVINSWLLMSVQSQLSCLAILGKNFKVLAFCQVWVPWYNRTGWLGVKHQLAYSQVWATLAQFQGHQLVFLSVCIWLSLNVNQGPWWRNKIMAHMYSEEIISGPIWWRNKIKAHICDEEIKSGPTCDEKIKSRPIWMYDEEIKSGPTCVMKK